MSETGSIYKAIAAVMSDLSKVGIGKDQQNKQQGFKFRGIDDVYNALAPLLSKHGVVILPRCLDREVTQRESKSGGALFHTVLKMEFDFVAAQDGSKHTVGPIYGEAMDSGDKSISKAMSIALKYGCFQTFFIPTEGDNDPDKTAHEVVPEKAEPTISKTQQQEFVDAATATGMPVAEIKALIKRVAGVESSARVPEAKFLALMEAVKKPVAA